MAESLKDFIRQRGTIQELHPDIARKAIEGYEDELAPAQRTDDSFYRQFACPSCGCSSMTKEFPAGPRGSGTTWIDGEVTPQALLRCCDCKLLMNPRSGLIVESGGHAPLFNGVEDELDPGTHR
jgi:hypothetical protein